MRRVLVSNAHVYDALGGFSLPSSAVGLVWGTADVAACGSVAHVRKEDDAHYEEDERGEDCGDGVLHVELVEYWVE